MKNTNKLRIILDVLIIIIGIFFLANGIEDAYNSYTDSKIDDNIKFKQHYLSVKNDNIYKFKTALEIEKILDDDTGVILIGNPSDKWTIALVNPLDDIISEYLNEIYYLEIDDKGDYTKIENKIGLITNPTIVVVDKGAVLINYKKEDIIDENYNDAPTDYFKENKSILKEKLKIISKLEN